MKRRLHKVPREIWILFDLDNGDGLWPAGICARRYYWWFETRTAAMRHRREQRKHPFAARLSAPVRYRVVR